MKRPSDFLAANLKSYFEDNKISTNGLANQSGIPQKTIWVCVTGTNAPSVNTARIVCDSARLSAPMLCLDQYTPSQLLSSQAVEAIAKQLMRLDRGQLKFIKEMVDGLAK